MRLDIFQSCNIWDVIENSDCGSRTFGSNVLFFSIVSWDLARWPRSSWTQLLPWEAWIRGMRCFMVRVLLLPFNLLRPVLGGRWWGLGFAVQTPHPPTPATKLASLGTKSALLQAKILCCWLPFNSDSPSVVSAGLQLRVSFPQTI